MTTPVVTESQTINRVVDVRLRVFAALWAIGHLLHLLNDDGAPVGNVFGLLAVFAAVYLLAKPSSVRRLGALAAIQLVHVLWTAPLLPDHWVLAAAGNLVILLSLGIAATRRQSIDDGAAIFASIMPGLKVILLIAYSAAAIAKYNTTFLDPVTSCANFLTKTATGGLVGDGDGLGSAHILSAIVPETLIPILLILPFTRRFGVRFGIAFHLFLAISPLLVVGDFSVMLAALFLLFASDEDIDAVMAPVQRRLEIDPLAARLREFDRPLVVAGAVTLLTFVMVQTDILVTLWVWLLLVAVLPRVLLSLLRMPDQLRGSGASFGRLSPAHLPIALLLLMWVLMPYVGFRTTGVFTMFSNLRTEGPGTNHVFMPSHHPTDHQTDLVFPGLESTGNFDDLIENGQAVSSFEVRRFMSSDDSIVVAGTRNGDPITETDLDEFREPNSGILNRLLHLRPIPMTDDPPCIN